VSWPAAPADLGRRRAWERAQDWPHRGASRFVAAGGVEWHVQQWGAGPMALLVHGTAASTHSWRDVAPLLAEQLAVVAVDLPGHGFTSAPPRGGLALPAIAQALGALLSALSDAPAVVAGHSAGAAILARLLLDGRASPRAFVSLNGALLPLHGLHGRLFSPAAKLLAAAPFVPRWVARRARDPVVIRRLIAGMGSTLPADGVECYTRLGSNAAHVAAALEMMASWDLPALERDLPRLRVPLTLIVGERDLAIPPDDAQRVARLVPGAVVRTLSNVGHLAHEEQPGRAADCILAAVKAAGILPLPASQR
jgi:magnesium chelatase accessory protein